jgi:hypothetical protein
MNSNEAGPSAAETSDASVDVPPASGDQLDAPPDADPSRSNESAFFRFSRKRRLDDLISALDRLVWVEMALLYYLDNSFLRFLLRAAAQTVYLMPKSPPFPEPTTPQPVVGAFIGINFICVALHLYSSQPEAGEGTRGYLHGGLLLDFIGQQGPTSKLYLFLLDVFVTFLQFLSLAVVVKRKNLEKIKEANTTTIQPEASAQSETEPLATQDYNAEERGERRRGSILEEALAPEESVGLLDDQDQERGSASSNLQYAQSDVIASGQAMIAELYVWDALCERYHAYNEYRSSTAGLTAGDSVAVNVGRRRYELNLPFRN